MSKITFRGFGTVEYRDGLAYVSSKKLTDAIRRYQPTAWQLEAAQRRVEAIYTNAPDDWQGTIMDHNDQPVIDRA